MAGWRERREGEIKEQGEEEEEEEEEGAHQLTEMRGNRFSSRSSAFGCGDRKRGRRCGLFLVPACVSLCASVVRAFTLRDKCGQHSGRQVVVIYSPSRPRPRPGCSLLVFFFFSENTIPDDGAMMSWARTVTAQSHFLFACLISRTFF
jgi:hypothetical protein